MKKQVTRVTLVQHDEYLMLMFAWQLMDSEYELNDKSY